MSSIVGDITVNTASVSSSHENPVVLLTPVDVSTSHSSASTLNTSDVFKQLNDDTYILATTTKIENIHKSKIHDIPILYNAYVDKIILKGVPKGIYSLTIDNNSVILTSYTVHKSGDDCIFDFTQKRSQQMNIIIQACKPRTDVPRHNSFLDLSRLADPRIKVNNIQLEEKYTLELHGYFNEDYTHIETKTFEIRPKYIYNIGILLNGRVSRIFVNTKNHQKGKLYLHTGEHTLIPEENEIYDYMFLCKNFLPDQEESKIYTQKIVDNTLNMSRVSSVHLLSYDTEVTELWVERYNVYNYKSGQPLFI